MGLSSKQVSRDGVGWDQALLQAQMLELPKSPSMKRQQPTNQQQQAEPLKCPRCDSNNTKFCYYNNYNKSQPRHYCKACKRHWTKGGTLRNVPVGGGRKNKRLKTSNTSANTAATTTTATTTTTTTTTATTTTNIDKTRVSNTHMGIQCQQPIRQNLGFAFGDQKNLSLYQAMIHHPSVSSSSNLDMKDLSTKHNGLFIGSSTSTLSLPQNQNQTLLFPYSSSTSFGTTPSSISTSIQSSNVYNYPGETIDEPTITSTFMPTTTSSTQPWQFSTTISSTGMDTTSYLNWDDIDTFVSTDLNNWVDGSDHVRP